MNKIINIIISFYKKIKGILFRSTTKKDKDTKPLSPSIENTTNSTNLIDHDTACQLTDDEPRLNTLSAEYAYLTPNKRETPEIKPQIPKIISASIVSITKLDSKNSKLKLAIYFNCKIVETSNNDFIILINNLILKDMNAVIIDSILKSHLIELTTTIPTPINSSNISILLGSGKTNALTTKSITGHCLENIFPYIKCSILNPSSFRWIVNESIVIDKDNTNYYTNEFIYKLDTPLCIYNFAREFTLYPEYPNITLDIKHLLTINESPIATLKLKIVNNYNIDTTKDLGSIVILFYKGSSSFNYNSIFNYSNEALITLENNNREVHFKINLPISFINNMSLIHSYYEPSEYLLTAFENTIFVNASYKAITTRYEVLKKE